MTLIVRPDYHAVPILEKNGIRWIPPSQAMRQDGLSLGHIGNHLGHQSAVSTERYSHFSGEETLKLGPLLIRSCTDKLIPNAYENAYEIDFKNVLNYKSLKLWRVGGGSLFCTPQLSCAFIYSHCAFSTFLHYVLLGYSGRGHWSNPLVCCTK